MMAAQPFTSVLVLSNPMWFKYCLVWDRGQGFGCNAPRRPIPVHEDICVFSPAAAGNGARQSMVYNPQGCQSISRLCGQHDGGSMDHHHPGRKKTWRSWLQTRSNYPTSVLHIPQEVGTTRRLHPTQKPLALMEYLVRTYTNEGSTVLDPFMGSGTTGVACQALGRGFVGIEKDEHYHAIAQRRLSEAQGPLFAGTATNGSECRLPAAPSQGSLFPE
jgi:site-specific DNA-methyltransferase (adenine-specific)